MGLESDIKSAKGHISNTPQKVHFTGSGYAPYLWFGDDAVDGDADPWLGAPVGSIYEYKASELVQPAIFIKRSDNARDDDWGAVGGNYVFQQRITRAQFTDGGSTVGTLVLTGTIPAGAWVEQTILKDVTGFTGDTSATILVGDGSDADRYSTGTPSVFTTAVAIDVGVPSGTKVHVAAVSTVTITVTSAADFTNVAAGAMTVCIHYKL